jgi:hypothetical protein
MNTTPIRIGGKVHKLNTPQGAASATSGIILGDDGRHYFFLPSYLKDPHQFSALIPESTTVQFAPRKHARGMRARNISVTPVGVSAHG